VDSYVAPDDGDILERYECNSPLTLIGSYRGHGTRRRMDGSDVSSQNSRSHGDDADMSGSEGVLSFFLYKLHVLVELNVTKHVL